MEGRRQQHGLGGLQALGTKKSRGIVSSGFGEDLGSTNYTGRPKIARNPRTKSEKEMESQDETSRAGSPITDVDPDGSLDPIDFISSQGSDNFTSAEAKSRTGPTITSKQAPQPAPFRRSRPTEQTNQASSTSSVASKSKTTLHQTGKARRIVGSDKEDLVSRPSSLFTAVPNKSKEPPPPLQQASQDSKPTANGPQPAPFRKRAQPGEVAPEKDKLSPRVPAPPPWKTGNTSQVGSKRDTTKGLLERSDVPASQRVGESQIDRESLKSVRIPKKNNRNTKTITPVPMKETREESKKATFPMAGYAKEAAAKQADDAIGTRSPRKRFKPDDVEPPLDPHNLCPFCDEPFPDNPSPDLIELLTDIKKIAVSEPRLRNPNGLTAPLMTYINLCQMHRAESTHVEQGRRNHWPSVIDWDNVRERLKSSKVVKALRTVINDPYSSEFFVTFYNNIKRDGVLKAASIRAQLDTFELSHPGYYGEQGLLVFFDTLNELFPNLTSDECKPLTTRQFFMSVLVPEAAALLIEQDMDCTHEEALITLRESRQYGLAMFPDRGGFFGSGKGDHMDEAGAKQLKWRKDMVGSTYSGNRPRTAQSPVFKSGPLEEESDPDILIVD